MSHKGETIYIYVDQGSASAIILLYLETEVNIDDISLSQPSLDDVFLKQTGRRLQATEGVICMKLFIGCY